MEKPTIIRVHLREGEMVELMHRGTTLDFSFGPRGAWIDYKEGTPVPPCLKALMDLRDEKRKKADAIQYTDIDVVHYAEMLASEDLGLYQGPSPKDTFFRAAIIVARWAKKELEEKLKKPIVTDNSEFDDDFDDDLLNKIIRGQEAYKTAKEKKDKL